MIVGPEVEPSISCNCDDTLGCEGIHWFCEPSALSCLSLGLVRHAGPCSITLNDISVEKCGMADKPRLDIKLLVRKCMF